MLPHTQVQRRRRRYIRPRYTYDFILPSSLKMQLAWFHTCHATTLSLRMNLISSKHIPQSQIASTQMPNHPIEEDLTKRKPTRAKLGQQRDHRPTEENLSKKEKKSSYLQKPKSWLIIVVVSVYLSSQNGTYGHETCKLLSVLHVSEAEGVFGDGFRASSAMWARRLGILRFPWLWITSSNHSCCFRWHDSTIIISHFLQHKLFTT